MRTGKKVDLLIVMLFDWLKMILLNSCRAEALGKKTLYLLDNLLCDHWKIHNLVLQKYL